MASLRRLPGALLSRVLPTNSWHRQNTALSIALTAILVGFVLLAVGTSHTVFHLFPATCGTKGENTFAGSCANARATFEFAAVVIAWFGLWLLLLSALSYVENIRKQSRIAHVLAGTAVAVTTVLAVWLSPLAIRAAHSSFPTSIGTTIDVVIAIGVPVMLAALGLDRLAFRLKGGSNPKSRA